MKLFQICFILVFCHIVYSHNLEKRFWKDVNEKVEFKRFIRKPMLNKNKQIKVAMEIVLYTILSLNKKDNILETSAGIKLSWKDESMKVNSSSFGNINITTVSSSDIWTPDICLINNAEDTNILEDMNKRISIDINGKAEWSGFLKIKTHCFVNTTKTLFDTQVCELLFTAQNLDHRKQELVIQFQDGSLNDFRPTGEEIVLSVKTYRMTKNLHGKIFTDEVLKIVIYRRKSLFVWTYSIPTISCGIVGLFSIFIPGKTSSKIKLSIYVVLNLLLLKKLFNESLPIISDNNCSPFEVLLLCLMFFSGTVLLWNISRLGLDPSDFDASTEDRLDSWFWKVVIAVISVVWALFFETK